eukprot:TRINITY_DN13997_c0_g1_i1.p1 TRINITY_DN13997_c0_g1~~TRINITY_DN13997_c0_g1_i1.p1  ORF type:complete len:248 (-),score=56.35 TRINITY_DN13997_c0_g1_i1:157-879(-)
MQAALCCLHTVDVLHVPTYLDQKLWVERRPDPNLFKAQILAICTRLCSAVQRNLEEDKSQYLQDLTAICAAINEKLSVKELLVQVGVERLFPRVLCLLNNVTCPAKVDMGSTISGYMILLSCYNQAHQIAALLQHDITTLKDHKYIAHQVVLLHQSVSKCGKALEPFKAEIEMHFEDVKQEIEGTDQPTVMSEGMQEWFCDYLERLAVHAATCAAAALARLPCGKDLKAFFDTDLRTLRT